MNVTIEELRAAAARLEGIVVRTPVLQNRILDERVGAWTAEALARTQGNAVAAARLLRLTRDAVRYRMKKLGLASGGAGTGDPG